MAVDAQGCVYVAGASSFPPPDPPRPTTQLSDAFLVKYDAAGRQLWVSRYEGSQRGVNYSFFSRLTLDGNGNIFAAGASAYLYDHSIPLECLIAKYDQTTPRLSVHGFPSSGVFQGCLVSPAGTRFDVQATEDFQTWEPVATVSNINGLVPFLDMFCTSLTVPSVTLAFALGFSDLFHDDPFVDLNMGSIHALARQNSPASRRLTMSDFFQPSSPLELLH